MSQLFSCVEQLSKAIHQLENISDENRVDLSFALLKLIKKINRRAPAEQDLTLPDVESDLISRSVIAASNQASRHVNEATSNQRVPLAVTLAEAFPEQLERIRKSENPFDERKVSLLLASFKDVERLCFS